MPFPLITTATQRVVIRGRTTRNSDPMWDARRDASLVKLLPVSELPTTVSRWLALGRKITSIEEWR